MASTNFLQFNPSAVNQESDAQFTADSNRTGGFGTDAIWPSPLANKLMYQLTTFVAAFGQMMAGKGFTTSDADLSVLAGVLANIAFSSDQIPAYATLPYSTAPVFDFSASNGIGMTLAGNINSSTTTGQTLGQLVWFFFGQDATGGRTIAWPSNCIGFGQPDPSPNSYSVIMGRVVPGGSIYACTPFISGNGVFVASLKASGQATLGSLALTSSGSAGQVLTNVGGLFVPQNLPARAAANSSVNDVTSARTFGATYTNTSSGDMFVSGWGVTAGGSIGSIRARIGNGTPSLDVYGSTVAATVNNGACPFAFKVPAGWSYMILANDLTNGQGSAVSSVGKWIESVSI